MHNTPTLKITIFGILFLFFLQALSDFIEAIYTFGLLVTAFTVEVASIVLLFTPLLLFLFRKPPSRTLLLGLAYVAIVARLLEPMLNPGGKLVACGISVGAFLLLFPALLHNRQSVEGWSLASGLVIAVALSIFFRTVNSSLDISESGAFQLISWLLAFVAAGLLWRTEVLSPQQVSGARSASGTRVTGLSIGLASVILMIYFAFASPTVIARWTGYSYPVVVGLLVTVFAAFGWLFGSRRFSSMLTRRTLLVWNFLFILCIVLTILPHQISFPQTPGAYPLDAPTASPLGPIFLFLMLLLSPVVFLDLMLFARQISLEKPSLHQIGGSFAVAALVFLLLVFFHVFTSVYDYVPVIGPFFRDRFWLVYLLVGLGMGLPILLVRETTFPVELPESKTSFTVIVLGSVAVLSLIAVSLTISQPVAEPSGTRLRVMTYNIQQGFDQEGNKNLEGQLAVIQSVNPDILGLEESDTARVANGNVDAVRYFADKLDVYSYYGPTTTTGTFGIALLSKYPIQNPKTFFMYSSGEQTVTIQAEITTGGKTYQVFVTHLGNHGPMVQLENLLARIQGQENVIAMGDFNFRPTTEQYALMTQTLADSWLLKWPGGKEIPGYSADRRIDHIFISPGITIVESEYGVNPASDHPYLYSVLQP